LVGLGFWHCTECKYDMCQACYRVDQKQLTQSGQFVHNHSCALEYVPNLKDTARGRKVNHCTSKNIDPESTCQRSINLRYKGALQSWGCTECNIDLCIVCTLKYKAWLKII
jgi:hypothetical protein